jgi:hypothetical protein
MATSCRPIIGPDACDCIGLNSRAVLHVSPYRVGLAYRGGRRKHHPGGLRYAAPRVMLVQQALRPTAARHPSEGASAQPVHVPGQYVLCPKRTLQPAVRSWIASRPSHQGLQGLGQRAPSFRGMA